MVSGLKVAETDEAPDTAVAEYRRMRFDETAATFAGTEHTLSQPGGGCIRNSTRRDYHAGAGNLGRNPSIYVDYCTVGEIGIALPSSQRLEQALFSCIRNQFTPGHATEQAHQIQSLGTRLVFAKITLVVEQQKARRRHYQQRGKYHCQSEILVIAHLLIRVIHPREQPRQQGSIPRIGRNADNCSINWH